jgi:hypothetical protein
VDEYRLALLLLEALDVLAESVEIAALRQHSEVAS